MAVYANSPSCRGIAVWRASDGKRLYEFEGSGGNSFAISPDGEILVVEDERTGTIAFVRIQDGAIIQTIDRSSEAREDGRILSSFSPAGQLYAIGPTNGSIKVWQIVVDAPLYTLTSPYVWTAISFSPDGKRLILASDAIQIWNATDGTLLRTLEGQSTIGEGGLFSPDGRI
ncbi:MAG TPA: hypothetical protein VJ436_08105, partial [Anaerolineales bacterium]|nr:hypothetical protein [Anaerolineales bacterium]